MPTATDLVTDLPADFEVFGQAVATSMADLLGGTTGQVLAKTSATDMDFTWTTPQVGDITGVTAGVGITGGGTSGTVTVTNDMATTITTNGDLLYGTGSGTYTRRAIGSTSQVLTVAGGVPTWATPSGSLTLLTTTAITATNSITIGSISSAYTSLIIFCENWALSGTANITMRLNGDTGSNYNPAQVQGQQGVINNNGTQTNFGVVQFSNVNGTNNGAYVISIPFYSATNAYKALTYQLSCTYGGTSNPVCLNGAVAYRSTSAISSFTFNTDAANFLAQGNIKIYGVN